MSSPNPVASTFFDLSGEWRVDDSFAAHLKQEQNHLSGTYDFHGGSVDGTVQGNVVTLRWDQPDNQRGGPTEMTIAPDGMSMSGTWHYDPAFRNSGLTGSGNWTYRPATGPPPSITTKVSVSSRQPWVDSGVDLKAGAALTITATGQWTNGGNPTYYADADGFKGVLYDQATLKSANFVALIGKVGDQVFLVGSAYQGTSPGAGRLYLQINEVPGDVPFADNDGAMDVEIRH